MIDNDSRFRLLVDAVQDYAIYILDLDGRIRTWNSGAERIKQYRADEVLGRSFEIFFPPDEIRNGLPKAILQQAATTGRYEGEGWRFRKDGSRFWASVIVNAMHDDQRQLTGFAKITRDLSERRRFEEALQLERDRLQVTLQSIADGVICTDTAGRITLMNPVAEKLTGWPFSEARALPVEEVFRVIDADTQEVLINPVRFCLIRREPYRLEDAAKLIARDGQHLDVQDSAAPIRVGAEILGTILVFQDVTKLRSAQREIAFSATHDSLTGLPNRRKFEASLENALREASASGCEHTICFLDLDRFKVVNDSAGHAAGDMLLRIVAQQLSHCVRDADLVARLGGDEFGLILNACTFPEAHATLDRILEAIQSIDFVWEGRLYKISASIGVTALTAAFDANSVMQQADVACYEAKNAGRNRISVYVPHQSEGHTRHQQLLIAADIRGAIRDGRLFLVAQRIVPVHGVPHPQFELLLRMRNTENQILPAGQFIPAAERYDLMGALDRWVFTEVLIRQAHHLTKISNLHLNINLSANSLNDPGFAPFFVELLQSSPLSPASLTIEITETALINNLAIAGSVLDKFRSLGCKIALDDFGIGVSSFSYLRNFSVDCIKIDGSFVRNICTNPVDFAIVRAISDVARQVNALTVAEFVENDATLAAITDLAVTFSQGYVHGRPVPLQEIASDGDFERS